MDLNQRMCSQVKDTSQVNELVLAYLNRLSDWFFNIARYINHSNGVDDVIWKL